jgi:hypothetical protein
MIGNTPAIPLRPATWAGHSRNAIHRRRSHVTMSHRWTEADIARLTSQKGTPQPQEARTWSQPRGYARLGIELTHQQMPEGDYLLIYPHDVPKSHGTINRWVRYSQKKRAVKYFGVLLPQDWCQVHAYVTITRVQGPRQRFLDDEGLYIGCKGLRDSLKACGYIRDDSRKWATFTYQELTDRRWDGPRIEVLVRHTT